jgi:putative membrane protein
MRYGVVPCGTRADRAAGSWAGRRRIDEGEAVRNLLIRWLVLAIAIAIAAAVVDGIHIDGGSGGLLAVAASFGLVNAFIRPIVRLLALPIRVMTLGLVSFVINGLMLLITDWLLDVLDVGGLWDAIVAAIVISVVSTLLNWLILDRHTRSDGSDA